MAPKIFLAHAREDKPQVRKLYADLRARGLDPWLDEIDLVPGQIWKVEIPKAIRDAGIFLACLSTRSVAKVGFVQNEFRLALSAFGERPPGSIFLIPVRLDDCDVPDLQIPDRDLSFRDIQWVDLWQEGGFDRLVNAIERALKGAAGPRLAGGEAPPAIPVAERRAEVAREAATPEQVVIADPPKAELKRAQTREPESPTRSRRNAAIVAAIIGAIGAVAAAPWLLERISGGNGESETASSGLAEEASPVPTPKPGPAARRAGEPFRDCDDCPQMVVVPAGSFTMGSPESEEGRRDNEGPQHDVTIAAPFAVGQYEVTFDEWDLCVADGGCSGYQPGDQGWGRGRRPVINVSWEDAQAYAEWLSKKTGEPYRLLAEAEWEYAARAGTTTPFWTGSTISTAQANYDGNYTYGDGKKGESRARTTPVDEFAPNPWGLHDVHGNVWEWVEDCWNGSYAGAPDDGSAWTTGDCSRRVLRGGSWISYPVGVRSAVRSWNVTDFRSSDWGFRVARTLP